MSSLKRTLGADTSARVLLAEDDDDLRYILGYALREDGHTVIEVTTGSELLDFLGMAVVSSQLFDYPDVIVADLLLPGFSGIEVLTGLRVAGWSIPFILMTGVGDRHLRERAMQLGAVAFFKKPFDVDDLRTVLINVTS